MTSGALDVERAAECLDPVAQALETAAGGLVSAADAIVYDFQVKGAGGRRDADLYRRCARVLLGLVSVSARR